MKKRLLILLLSIMPLFALYAQEAGKEIRGMLEYFEKLQKEITDAPNEETRQKIIKSARKRALMLIDTELIGELSLGEHYDKLTKEQKKEYIEIFRELFAYHIVETHIPAKAIAENPVKVKIISQQSRYDPLFFQQAEVVKVMITRNKVRYRASFYLLKYWSGYKIYDIHFDGASLLMDYRVQFQSIVQNKGFDYLLSKLKSRMQEIYEKSE